MVVMRAHSQAAASDQTMLQVQDASRLVFVSVKNAKPRR